MVRAFKSIIWTCEECETQYGGLDEADDCCSFELDYDEEDDNDKLP